MQLGACGALKTIISDFPISALQPYLDRIYTGEHCPPSDDHDYLAHHQQGCLETKYESPE